MSNIQCSACNKTKKEENFTTKSIADASHVCNACDLRMLQRRLEGFDRSIISLKKQQQVVKEVTRLVENKALPPKKVTSFGFLKNILQSAQ